MGDTGCVEFQRYPEWWKVIDNSAVVVPPPAWNGAVTGMRSSSVMGAFYVSPGSMMPTPLDAADAEQGMNVVLTTATILNTGTRSPAWPDPQRSQTACCDPWQLRRWRQGASHGERHGPEPEPDRGACRTSCRGCLSGDGSIIHAGTGTSSWWTEMGIFSSDDAGQTRSVENNGIPAVPVFAVRQQT